MPAGSVHAAASTTAAATRPKLAINASSTWTQSWWESLRTGTCSSSRTNAQAPDKRQRPGRSD